MQAHIENLVKLQGVELERARIAKEAGSLPAQIADAEAALAAAQREADKTSAALGSEDALRARLDSEISDHRKKAAHFRVQLDSVTNPAQAEAAEHGIEFASAEADRLENDEFASMERSEALEAALALARAQIQSLTAALEKTRARVALTQQELAAQLAALDTERAALRPLIEPEWLTRFDRLTASRGTALACANNQRCSGCRMAVRPQTWNQLRAGELLPCDSCARLLYWDPTIAPAPEEPRPSPIPGAGRAPRKQRLVTDKPASRC